MAEMESGQFSDLNSSDGDIETINTEELVMFDSIRTFYSNRNDIVVIYSLGNAVENSSKDWVGVFKSGWETTQNFCVYQWVPLRPHTDWEPWKRKSIFPQADIKELSGHFQFLYVTGEDQVIGVSEVYEISDSENLGTDLTVSPICSENIEHSLSIISLGSTSTASSDEPVFVEEPNEATKKSTSEQIIARPQQEPVVIHDDKWTLSDLAVGNASTSLRNKLCVPETFDPSVYIEDYGTLKDDYLFTRKKNLIKVLGEGRNQVEKEKKPLQIESSVKKPCLLSSPPTTCSSSPSSATLQHTLDMSHQNLLDSALEEAGSVCISEDPSKSSVQHQPQPEVSKVKKVHTPMDDQSAETGESRVAEDGSLDREKAVTPSVQQLETDENFVQSKPKFRLFKFKHKGHLSSCEKEGSDKTLSDSSETSHNIPAQAPNLKKKRFVQSSKSKITRNLKTEMLEEALSLIPKESSPTQKQHTPETSNAPSSEKIQDNTREVKKAKSRKRPYQSSEMCHDESKRRRLKPSASPIASSCSPDDEGYFSNDNDDNGKFHLSTTRELGNNTPIEACKKNGKNDTQVRQTEEEKQPNKATEVKVIAVESLKLRTKSKTKRRAVNTEVSAMHNAASNTACVAKKDTTSQCSAITKGKAMNTEPEERHHAASNTAAILTKDTRTQCSSIKTKGKAINTEAKEQQATNTESTHSQTKTITKSTNTSSAQDKSLRDNAVSEGSSSAPSDSTGKAPQHQNGKSLTPSSAACPGEGASGDLEAVGEEPWRKVCSKRTLRLQRLVSRKRQEFAQLKENAASFEERAHYLETQLFNARSVLVHESRKRLSAEKDLSELRGRFWKLMATRKSQPWTSVNLTQPQSSLKVLPVKPMILTDPDKFPVTNARSDENQFLVNPTDPDQSEEAEYISIPIPAETETPLVPIDKPPGETISSAVQDVDAVNNNVETTSVESSPGSLANYEDVSTLPSSVQACGQSHDQTENEPAIVNTETRTSSTITIAKTNAALMKTISKVETMPSIKTPTSETTPLLLTNKSEITGTENSPLIEAESRPAVNTAKNEPTPAVKTAKTESAIKTAKTVPPSVIKFVQAENKLTTTNGETEKVPAPQTEVPVITAQNMISPDTTAKIENLSATTTSYCFKCEVFPVSTTESVSTIATTDSQEQKPTQVSPKKKLTKTSTETKPPAVKAMKKEHKPDATSKISTDQTAVSKTRVETKSVPAKTTSPSTKPKTARKVCDSGESFSSVSISFTASTTHSSDSQGGIITNGKERKNSTSNTTPIMEMRKSAQVIPVMIDQPVKSKTEGKKTTTTTMSFKKFIMPAMTAIAETFSSSKSKQKSTDSGHSLASACKFPEHKDPNSSVAKIVVSISAAPTKTTTKTTKSETKSRKSKSSRSSSRNREETCLYREETNANEAADIVLNSKPASSLKTTKNASGVLDKKQNHSQNAVKDCKSAGSVGWSPQTIPLTVVTQPRETLSQKPAPPCLLEPVKFCFSRDSTSNKSQVNATDSFSGKEATNNEWSKAAARCEKDETLLDFIKAATRPYQTVASDVITAKLSPLPDIVLTADDKKDDAEVERTPQSPAQCSAPPLPPKPPTPIPSPHIPLIPPPVPLPPANWRASPLIMSPRWCAPACSPAKPAPSLAPRFVNYPPRPLHAMQMARELSIHGKGPAMMSQPPPSPPLRYRLVSQQQKPSQLSWRPPRALHYEGPKACSNAVNEQIRQGRCMTCGINFAPSVDRYLVEEHIYFHHTFAE